jgi:transcription antitermination factor NusB
MTHVDKRTKARELAMQALYQLDVQGSDLLDRLPVEFFALSDNDARTRQLAQQWTAGTWKNLEECDEMISSAAIRWQFSRLSPVDRSILRLSVYQLKFCPDIPPKVVINEAIELAKRFSTEKSGPFVNGVLDAVLKKLPPAPATTPTTEI